MTVGHIGASVQRPATSGGGGWAAPSTPFQNPSHHSIIPGDLPSDPASHTQPYPTDDAPTEPPAGTPDDPNGEPPVQRSTTLATLRSMRQSSGAAFADSAYFTGLFERDDSPTAQRSGVKPDWSTIGLAGATVAGLGGLYQLGRHLEATQATKTAGVTALEGAARAVGGFGRLAIFATPILAAGVMAPALADLTHLAAPNTFKQNREIPDGLSQNERNRLNNNNDDAWLGRIAAGAVTVGVLSGAALLLHKQPFSSELLQKFAGGGWKGAARGAAALGLVGGVSAGAFYNVFDKNGDITRTHSPLRSY